MPTDNRSRNTEMASVPPYIGLEPLVGRYYPALCRRCGWVGSSEDLTEDDAQCTRDIGDRLCLGDCDELGRDDLLCIIQAMAKAAQQHQGEPVAWRGINELGDIVTEWIDGAPPEAMVDLCGQPASFASLELAYTHADPASLQRSWQAGYDTAWYAKNPAEKRTSVNPSDHAEVERLRAKIEQLRTALRGRQEQWSKLEAALLGQLGEAHALLAETRTLLHRVTALGGAKIGTLYSHALHMGHRIAAALSASTEPSEREKQALQDEKRLGIERLPAEPSAPVEIDHDALVAAACVLRSQGLGNLSAAVEEARAAGAQAMKIHWAAHIEFDHDGNDHEHFSACGVGRGLRDGEEWESARHKSEVTCKTCLKVIAKQERKPS